MFLALCLIISTIPAFLYIFTVDEVQQSQVQSMPLDFNALSELYGDRIPVVVRLDNGVSPRVQDIILSLGLEFSLGSASNSHIGPYYLLRGSSDGLQTLTDLGIVSDIAIQTNAQFLESPRDLSIPEVNADDVWMMLDGLGTNVTGEGILIADLDSGVDWRHPDLWFADGGSYDWLEGGVPNAQFDNGTDGIDFNPDSIITSDEALYFLDLNQNGIFNVRTEWTWVDNVTQNGFPDIGEPFFVVNDTSGDGLLDLGERLVMLRTPKTKYIFEKDGNPSPSIQSWIRGVNLTSSTHTDDSPFGEGHGTAVAGILLGGQLGYRDYVGVAPSAELMMIRVLGDQFTWLTIEEGLTVANNTGADVILTEIGSWTYHYLDGSSLAEQMIDILVANGIPVISPSGNLGGKDKHAMITTTPDVPHLIDFSVPAVDGLYVLEDIAEVYITVLTVDSVDFLVSNFSLWINGTTIYLHPGLGEWAWFLEPNVIPGLNIQSYTSISTRGTRMLAIWIYGVLPTTPPIPFYRLNISTPDPATIHAYISDDQSGWTGGSVWMSDMVDSHHITWPSTADSALSVASYRTRNLVGGGTVGDRASFSSNGPRIDGISKQGVAAPGGYDIISDYANGSSWSTWYNGYSALPFNQQFGSYRLFSGTSASGPHVAGAAALMLQVNSTIGNQVKTILESTAVSDGFTGVVPNPEWGHGKLDVEAAVSFLLDDTTPPTIGIHDRIPFAPNSTQTVLINVTVTDDVAVDTVILSYYNGSTWFNITMSWNGWTYYDETIPAFPVGISVNYRFYTNDTSGNWAVSGTFSYTVTNPSTTTTTTTTTTITTSTGTTNTTTPTTTLPAGPDYLRIAILLSAIFALIVLSVVCSRRRSE